MPIGTAVHERTLALCESLNYRDWAGYFAPSAYETQHEHEYAAIRTAAGLIDVTPLFKYIVSGPEAARLVDRIIVRDVRTLKVGQVIYTQWCDSRGKVIDDGTVTRLEEQRFRWTAAEPNLRWFRMNAAGLDVTIEDVSDRIAALAVQGPTAGAVLKAAAEVDIANLRYFRVVQGLIAGVAVDISRTGYTGDLGYEVWMPWESAVTVWDRLMSVGASHGLRPAGMLALDIARVEAGLLLIDVDFFSSRKALLDEQMYSPFEMGLDRLVHLDKAAFVGQRPLVEERARGPRRRIVGLRLSWDEIEALYERRGLAPQMPAATSRVAVPVYRRGRQIGRATSTTWSPTLKQLLALATVDATASAPGTTLDMEVTVEAVRHRVTATVVPTPFFNPPRKTQTPV